MELKKNPNAKRQFCPLTSEVCGAPCVSLIKMLRLLTNTNSCSALLHLFLQRTACGNRFFALAARRDSKKIQPKGPRRGQKRMRKSAAELIFFWVMFVRTEIPCLQPKGYAQLRSQSQFCLAKCAPPIPVLYRARRIALNQSNISTPPPGHESARKGGPGMCCCIYFQLSA
jgi:hypothetical protein